MDRPSSAAILTASGDELAGRKNTQPVRPISLIERHKSSPASYFTALAALTANDESDLSREAVPNGRQYEAIMDRFQIRHRQYNFDTRDQHLASSRTIKTHSDDDTARSAREEPTICQTGEESQCSDSCVRKSIADTERLEDGKTSNSKQANSIGRFSLLRVCTRTGRRLGRAVWSNIGILLAPVSPYSTVSRVRSAALISSGFAYAMILPVEVAFNSTTPKWFDAVGDLVDLMLLVDFVLMFNTSFITKGGTIVRARQEIAAHYLRGWFVPDLLSSIPIHWLDLITENQSGWYFFVSETVVRSERVIHLLHVLRLAWFVYAGRSGKSIWAWLLYSRYSYLIRITWIIALVLLLTHYIACFWKMLVMRSENAATDFADEYAANFYYALQLLQGQGLATVTLGQNVFASFAVLAGSIVLAIVFGHVAMLVSNFNANSTNYQRKMESVFAIMTKMQLPAPLRERIHQYYEHLWREYDSLDGEIVKFSKDLTHNLALEVVLFKYMVLVMHVPFWRECSADFQKQIVLHLQVRVYLPDDFIIRRGEVGDEFYMINRGCCELARDPESVEHGTAPLHSMHDNADNGHEDSLYSSARYHGSARYQNQAESGNRSMHFESEPDPDFQSREKAATSLIQLSRGQAFGEIALLMNYERTANVRAVSYVEMCVLTRGDFEDVLKRYPIDRRHVIMQILTRFMDQNKAHRGFCPLKDMVRSVMYDGSTDVPLSTKHAALLVAEVIDPKLDDETVKFRIDSKLAQQLSALRNTHSISAALSPALEARLDKINETQSQTLRVVQDVLRAVEDLKRGPVTAVTPLHDTMPTAIAGANRSLEQQRVMSTDQQVERHPLRHVFVRGRSISAPDVHELETAVVSNVETLVTKFESVHPANHIIKSKATAIKSMRKQASERKLSSTSSEMKTRKPFFERLVQLSSIAGTPVQSPTQYADQLFQRRDTGLNLPLT